MSREIGWKTVRGTGNPFKVHSSLTGSAVWFLFIFWIIHFWIFSLGRAKRELSVGTRYEFTLVAEPDASLGGGKAGHLVIVRPGDAAH